MTRICAKLASKALEMSESPPVTLIVWFVTLLLFAIQIVDNACVESRLVRPTKRSAIAAIQTTIQSKSVKI